MKFDDHSHAVLVVEDDREVRSCVADLLEESGFISIDAKDTDEALEILSSGIRPLAMLIDLHLPGGGGERLCHSCAVDPRFATIPRIVTSGHRDAPSRLAGCAAVAFFPKPIEWPQLIRTLNGLDAAYDPAH
jgi:two-component system OmpR family response regulator